MNTELNCIKRKTDTSIGHVTGNSRKLQVLVNFGLGRKKVFYLDGCKSLAHQFKDHVSLDPEFSKLLRQTFLVFQQYNEKFGTWVDVDSDDNLKDGAVVKAVFFPKTIEPDDTKSGSIKRRREDEPDDRCESKRYRPFCDEVDISSDSSTVSEMFEKTHNVKPLEDVVINDNIEQTSQNEKNGKESAEEVEKNSQTGKIGSKIKQSVKCDSFSPVSCVLTEQKNDCIQFIQNENYMKSTKIDTAVTSMMKLNKIQQSCSVERYLTRNLKQQTSKTTVSSESQTPSTNADTKRTAAIFKQNHIFLARWHGKHRIKMTQEIVETRLLWGIRNVHSVDIWKNFIFTGISCFCVRNSRIQLFPPAILYSKYSTYKIKQMFWGSVTFDGTVIISTVDLNVPTEALYEILKDHILPFVEKYFPGGVMLQHDLPQIQYKSHQITELLKGTNVLPVEWPHHVRDMNPLEHVWDYIAEKVKKIYCSNIDGMISVIYEIWSEDYELKLLCNNFVLSMQEIVNDLILRQGGRSKMVIRCY